MHFVKGGKSLKPPLTNEFIELYMLCQQHFQFLANIVEIQ